MTQIQDNICKLRDIFSSEDYSKIVFYHSTIKKVFDEVHRNMARKVVDYNYELEFTAQDLRELAQDIRAMFKRWETIMNPEDNIREIHDKAITNEDDQTKQINIETYMNKVLPIMATRRDNMQVVTELLNLIEYHSVYLYWLEIAAKDEFAIKCTERLV